MEQIVIDKNDEMVMKLLHYFITEMGYSPIVLHGAKDEIWLEKLNGDYQIIRIVSNYIHNDEQLNFDLFRTKQIMKQIKKKTFSTNLNTLSLFVNLGDNVNIDKYLHNQNVDCASINSLSDINKYDFIMDNFPTITKKTKFSEKGMELFSKITDEIGKKNREESIKNEEVFQTKKPIVTCILIAINVLVFILYYMNNSIANYLVLYKGAPLYSLITAVFTHINPLHLLFNMYALYVIGSQIESFYGKAKYIIIYLGSALIASLTSLIFIGNNYSLGASGAIFGLLGALLFFGYNYRLYLGETLRSQVVPLIIFNLFLGFYLPHIDNAAHIGGLIGGAFISIALGVKYKTSKSEKINGLVLLIILSLFLSFIAFM